MQFVKINTNQNPTNMIIKPLSKEKYDIFRRLAGMTSTSISYYKGDPLPHVNGGGDYWKFYQFS